MSTASVLQAQVRRHLRTPLYTNAYYLMVNTAFGSALGFVYLAAVTWRLPVESVGTLGAILAAVNLIAMFATLGLGYGLIRFLPERSGREAGLLNVSLLLAGLVGVVAGLIFLLGAELWSPPLEFIARRPLYLLAFILVTGAAAASGVLNEALIGLRRASFVLAKDSTMNMIRLAMVVAVGYLLATTFNVFLAWGIPAILALTAGILLFLPRCVKHYRAWDFSGGIAVAGMLRYAMANHIANVLWLSPRFVLPLMVVSLLGTESGAYFYVPWILVTAMTIVPASLALSLFSEGSNELGQLRRSTLATFRLAIVILIPLVVLLLLASDKLLLAFGSAYAQESKTLMLLLAIALVPLTLNSIMLSVARVQKRTALIIGAPLLVAGLSLTLSWPFLTTMGIAGVGVAWLIGQAVVALGFLIYAASGKFIVQTNDATAGLQGVGSGDTSV